MSGSGRSALRLTGLTGLVCAGLAIACPAAAQVSVTAPGLTPVETAPVEISAGDAADWGIGETDWQRYRELMRGPAGLHYRRLSPAFVLGLHAETDADRDRWARIVYEEERQRLDRLFDFNRAYNRIARAERSREGFSFFDDRYLEPDGSGARRAGAVRPVIFVSGACAACDAQVRQLASGGRAFDIYYVGATGNQEVSAWARRVELPVAAVTARRITLNHDQGDLARAGYGPRDLPVLFADAGLDRMLTLGEALR